MYGTDYPTRDGTCVRDYIHVVDVARGHLDALRWMGEQAAAGRPGLIDVFNFGTGEGTTVLELVAAMEKAAGKKVNMVLGPRRDGDIDAAYANPSKAAAVLGWKPQFSIEDSCVDAWRWQSNNPNGFSADE